jgi:hypothetical protein
MKKEYIKPEMKVFKMQHQSTLLAGSVQSVKVMNSSYNDYGDGELEDL